MLSRNKRGKVIILVVAVVLAALAGCSSQDTPGEQGGREAVELKLAHFFPATHPVETDVVKPWAAAVAEATGGQVKITSYPGQTLLEADDIYDGVVNGIADIGLSCFSYTRGRFPVLEAFELPGITYRNSTVASRVAWEGIKKLQPQEVQDTKLLMVFATGPGDLFSKVPVRNLDDLQRLAVRATGLSAKTLEALGATPVAMPQSEGYEALSKGVVKGNLAPAEVLKGWKHAEVTGYLTRTPFLYNTLFFITMNLEKWNSLSPEVQQAIEEVSAEYFEKAAMCLWDNQNEAALEWAVEEHGLEVITLPEEEAQKWIELVEPIQDEFVAKMKEQGLPGEEILNTVKELADQYNKEVQ